MRRTVVATLIALATLAGSFAVPDAVEARPPKPVEGTYKVEQRLCNSPDGYSADIGGRVYMQEFGQRNVHRFKAKWLLYQARPTGINVALRQKEFKSPYFTNNAQNFWWRSSHEWTNVTIPDQGLKLVVKLTWERKNRRDWNEKVLVAYCG